MFQAKRLSAARNRSRLLTRTNERTRTMISTRTASRCRAARMRRARTLTGCPWHDVKSMLRAGRLAPDPSAHGARLDPVRQRRPPSHRRDAVRGSDAAPRCRCRWRRSTTRCTSSPKSACCVRSRSTARRPISTPTSPTHHHFFVEGDDELLDIPSADVIVGKTPAAPEGYEVARVDVVVRLREDNS